MSFSRDLITHAIYLAANGVNGDSPLPESASGRSICERRAVSAAYYALFHHINGGAVDLIAPNVPVQTNHRIQRWFEHAEIKKVCGRFLPAKLDQPLLDLIGDTASPDLRNVAQSFITLQEARHNADYNLGYILTSEETEQFILLALVAMDSWDRIANSAEANIFILSLLLILPSERVAHRRTGFGLSSGLRLNLRGQAARASGEACACRSNCAGLR